MSSTGTRETGNGSVCGRHCHSGGGGCLRRAGMPLMPPWRSGYALAVTRKAGIWAVVVLC
ncbi:hypothetical protein ACLK19_23090 [Escherichia coli]